jgi:hypothetical protein
MGIRDVSWEQSLSLGVKFSLTKLLIVQIWRTNHHVMISLPKFEGTNLISHHTYSTYKYIFYVQVDGERHVLRTSRRSTACGICRTPRI